MKNKNKNEFCTILIPSCDKYSDLWVPFFTLFFRHWRDCPFPVFLGSNEQTLSHNRVKSLSIGPDSNWSSSTKLMIESLASPYILMFLDDFFLRRTVNTEHLIFQLDMLNKLNGRMLRLIPRPGPDIRIKEFPDIGLIENGAPWRISTQVAIWRRDFLLEMLIDGESIWEFEVKGSERSNKYSEGLYCVWKAAVDYGHHVIERGTWFRNEAKHFGSMKIGCDFTRREIMTRSESILWNLKKMRGIALDCIPWKQRLILFKLLRQVRGKKPN